MEIWLASFTMVICVLQFTNSFKIWFCCLFFFRQFTNYTAAKLTWWRIWSYYKRYNVLFMLHSYMLRCGRTFDMWAVYTQLKQIFCCFLPLTYRWKWSEKNRFFFSLLYYFSYVSLLCVGDIYPIISVLISHVLSFLELKTNQIPMQPEAGGASLRFLYIYIHFISFVEKTQ